VRLADILQCSELDRGARLEIEKALGLVVNGARHIDNPPRAADYIAEFGRVRLDAHKLSERIEKWDYYYRDELFENIETFEQALWSLIDACGTVVSRYEAMGPNASKGRKKNDALAIGIARLRKIFRANYRGQREERKQRGAVESLAVWEQDETEFVRVALRDVRALRVSDLAGLMRDPRADPATQ
jgi:hypothetical protein